MAVYTIGDIHLSLSGNHSMEVFPGWENYVQRIRDNWQRKITDADTVVLAGDISWGMSLDEALADFRFINDLPGNKILIKGNHDYWWCTLKKISQFFNDYGLNTLQVLHNNSIAVDEIAICGSRGWLFETGEAFDEKIIRREAMRLETSIIHGEMSGKKPVVFMHYPPIYGQFESPAILEVLKTHNITHCYYGHIHAAGCRQAVQGLHHGIYFHLISSDFLKFDPLAVAV